MTETEARVRDLMQKKFEEPEFSDCFLLEIRLLPTNKLEVFIDSDSGVSFDQCQKVSRYLEGYLDEEGWLGERYVLEVSSPGVDRPLVLARQYPRNLGRKLEIKTVDGEKRTGLLTAVQDTGIELEVSEKIKEGKKTRRVKRSHFIPFESIEKALVKIQF